MKITMIKKIKADGNPCDKCMQVEELLKERALWDRIDDVIYADERTADSEGFKLAEKYQVTIAPFFIVEKEDADPLIYKSVLALINKELKDAKKESLSPNKVDLDQLKQNVKNKDPQEIISIALQHYGKDCSIAFSGAEDVVIIDMAVKSGFDFTVFSLDTGRLFPETYEYIEAVRKHYGIDIHCYSPDASVLEPFVREKGLYSFREDGHKECCGIRKVGPLKRALAKSRAWISGQRKDQSPATRNSLDSVLEDHIFAGKDAGRLIKFNPLADWTSQQVWDYIRAHNIPYNSLHEQGFISIGCQPCTRAILPAEHERAGRWWWEEDTKRECGLHVAE